LTSVKESGTDGRIVPPQQLLVEISVPGGEELAQKTFNPKLGIVGGISILGTTGIVEPMSEQAVVETIRAQIRMKRATGAKGVVAAPGNYGLQFLAERYGVLPDDVVMISNFVRDAAQMAGAEGMTSFLLAGHIGKLVKVAGGIGNTHSRYGDHRMEILWEIAEEVRREMRAGAGRETWKEVRREILPGAGETRRDVREPDQRDAQMPQEQLMEETAWKALRQSVMECVTTDAALALLAQCGRGFCDQVALRLAERIQKHLKEWGGEAMRVEVIVFAGQREELVRTPGAAELL
jgi:cobalt-precorrin-5B (C1)-methyltransferase